MQPESLEGVLHHQPGCFRTEALAPDILLAEIMAVIGAQDDDGVVPQTLGFDGVQHFAQPVIDPFSPSSWLKAHVPRSRSVACSWMAIASESLPRTRAWKKRSISGRAIGPSW